MTTVLWVKLETDPEDFVPDDLYELYERLGELDEHCRDLGVQPLTDFIDFTDADYNLAADEDFKEDEDEEIEPDEEWLEEDAKWVNPSELLETLIALRGAIGSEDQDEQLHDELAHATERCSEAVRRNASVRLIAAA